jgi:hypothetical protein
MRVISYITQHNTASRNLEKTLKRYGYNYVFIGLGKKWKGFVKGKIADTLAYLKTIHDDVVCVIDGYDMLACDTPDRLLKKYKTFSSPIVYGGDKFCTNTYNNAPVSKYDNISIKDARKYLNGGFCIGKRQEIMKMYEWFIEKGRDIGINDDQKMAGLYANEFPKMIDLDIYQSIVFNTIPIYDLSNFEMKNGRVRVLSYNSSPCFVHFPSSSSDEYKRYNTYGKKILKGQFKKVYSCGPMKFAPFYTLSLLVLSALVYKALGVKGLLLLLLIGALYLYLRTPNHSKG